MLALRAGTVRAGARAGARASVRAGGLPSRACEAGAPCHRLYARRERLQRVLSEAIQHAEMVRAAAARGSLEATSDLLYAMDVIEEMRTAITRLEGRLEDCIIEYDAASFEDHDAANVGERQYDL